ncbi:MAG: dihydroorotate dehydrogenase [Bacillota bacterium]
MSATTARSSARGRWSLVADLGVTFAGLKLKNPVMTASGTFGYGREYGEFFPLTRLGAVVTKGITLGPRAGNPAPRVVETPAGMLNSIGLENPGVDRFIEEELPALREAGATVIVNVSGHTAAEYAEVAARLDGAEGVAALEINVSCPNVDQGGMAFGVDPAMVAAVVEGCRRRTRRPLITKLTPNVTDLTVVAQAAAEAGSDALSLINTLVGMVIDPATRRPVLPRGVGGLSGPAVRPVAVRAVYEVAAAVDVPLIGLGGVTTAEDALQFILAGASAVAVGTAFFVDPMAAVGVIEGLSDWCDRNRVEWIGELVGAANPAFKGRRPGRD